MLITGATALVIGGLAATLAGAFRPPFRCLEWLGPGLILLGALMLGLTLPMI